jgi:hypothetical protein
MDEITNLILEGLNYIKRKSLGAKIKRQTTFLNKFKDFILFLKFLFKGWAKNPLTLADSSLGRCKIRQKETVKRGAPKNNIVKFVNYNNIAV